MAIFSSILDPGVGAIRAADKSPPDCLADLHLDQIVAAVTAGYGDSDLEEIFYSPLHDLSTVQYRQQVFGDLENEDIRTPVAQFVDGMRAVRGRLQMARNVWHRLQQQGWLITAVENYCHAVVLLRDAFAWIGPQSAGLRNFGNHITHYADGDAFTTLVAEVQTMRHQLRTVRYVVHIEGLHVHVEKFSGQTDYSHTVAETFGRFATEVGSDYRVPFPDFGDMNHVEEQILECVAKLHPEVFARLDDFCGRHQQFIEPALARFAHEVQFYLAYLAFARRLRPAGLTLSYPEVTDEPGAIAVDDAFDLALALSSVQDQRCPVTNDFHLSDPERILVVTGPNQGGKTTLARTIGQCVYLASVGCPIPARDARLSLPDEIFTHFERQEDLSTLHGKLDNELARIHDILSRASAASVIIMNESFSSTTVDDALLIGAAVLRRIIELGCVAVYVSFLDELSRLDAACVSMVGEVADNDPTQRTFKFTRRPADGLAYAAALADKYGLSHEKLRGRISQ